MKVLILGATGMLGHTLFRHLGAEDALEVWGTVRGGGTSRLLESLRGRVVVGVDVLDHDALVGAMARVRPDVVVNCVGIVKQLADANDPLVALPINALLPHRLARLCGVAGARLVHISTDCVFSGKKGAYRESDPPDAYDLYGQSKSLGEVRDQAHAVTLRTSIIGHELGSRHGLVEWFLSQAGPVRGFTRAVFSGLPTAEVARVLREHVFPNPSISGLYHLASEPIAKFDLLRLVADAYGKAVEVIPDDSLVVDRSLNPERFQRATGYRAPAWPDLVRGMFLARHL